MILRKMLMILLVVTLLASSISFAAFYEKDLVEAYDYAKGGLKQFKIVNIVMNGNDVISDVPPIIYEGRTLVPIRMVEELGAVVTWHGQDQQVEITYKGNTLILTIGSAIALVNGVEKTLPSNVPASIIGLSIGGTQTDRTMVPIRFVIEEFGMDVEWIDETQTVVLSRKKQEISNVYFSTANRYPEVRIKASGAIDGSSYILDGTKLDTQNKVVVDLFNTDLDERLDGATILPPYYMIGFGEIEVETYEKGVPITRVSIELDDKKGYETYFDAATNEYVVKFVNHVDGIEKTKLYGVDAVVIKTDEVPAYNPMLLQGKYVIDVVNASLTLNEGRVGSIEGDGKLIDKIRYSQMDPVAAGYGPDDLVTRVVIDLMPNADVEDVFIEHVDEEVVVYISGDPLLGFDYNKVALDTANISMELSGEGQVEHQLLSNNRLLLKVPMELLDIDELSLHTDDNIVNVVSIEKRPAEGLYYITAEMAEETTYQLTTTNNQNYLVQFVNERLTTTPYQDYLIVVDAGHGGKDPGAVGTLVYEKVLALQASLTLKKELEKEGFNVYMTRETDDYIGLYDRAHIANALGADLFISMHINASTSKEASGTQVLYYPNSSGSNYRLALQMKDKMVAALGSRDRGVVERPKLVVLRETLMPAVLVELGFISNEAEQSLMMQSSYQLKAVLAIKEAVKEYFD